MEKAVSMVLEELFLKALAITVIVETIVLFLLLKFLFKKDFERMKIHRIVFAGVIASSATIPYLWFILPRFLDSANYVYVGEFLIVLAETIILNQVLDLKIEKAFVLSLVCNVSSFLIGQFLL